LPREWRSDGTQPTPFAALVRGTQLAYGIAHDRVQPRQQVEQHDAEAVDVRSRVDLHPPEELGRKIQRGPCNVSRPA
jgi:hypothetical protein